MAGLEELFERLDKARDEIGRLPTGPSALSEAGIQQNGRDYWFYADLIVHAARAAGKTDAEIARAILLHVVPDVLRFRQRCLDLDRATYKALRREVEHPGKSEPLDGIPVATPLGQALAELTDAIESEGRGWVSDAVVTLYAASRDESDIEGSGKRLAVAIMNAIRKARIA